jgi:hypothetical protein
VALLKQTYATETEPNVTFIYSGKALKINVNKTKLMRINPPRITRSSNQPINQVIIDGAVVEEVKTISIKGNICTKKF